MRRSKSNTVFATILKLIIVSLLVGWVLALIDISPKDLLAGLGGTAQGIFEFLVDLIRKATPYVLLGGVVVVPVWLVMKLWGVVKKRD